MYINIHTATQQWTHRGNDMLASRLSLVDSVAPVAHHLKSRYTYNTGGGRVFSLDAFMDSSVS